MDDIKLRQLEFHRPSFRNILKEKLEHKCANCGSEINIEYHHVVPTVLGGTNRLTNIVPLCQNCHQIAHGAINLREKFKPLKTGRKKKQPPKGYEHILDSYLKGEIGRKECETRLCLSHGNKLTEKWYFKEYIKQHKIASYKNRIDMINCNKLKHKDHSGEMLAEIRYEDGTKYIKYVI